MKAYLLDYIVLTIVVIGAVDLGLLGIMRIDLIAVIFGTMSWAARIIYVLIGICGIYMLSFYGRTQKNKVP